MTFLPLAILAPFAGGLLAFLLGGRWAPAAGLAGTLAAGAASAGIARRVWLEGPLRYAVGGWGSPLGIDFYVDGLAAAMLLASSVTGLFITVYSLGYFPARSAFWPLWLMLQGALNALFLSADAFNYYVGLELMTLPAVALIALAPETAALKAAVRYLLAAFLGSLLYLMGVALLYGAFDALDIVAIGERMTPGMNASLALALVTAGLLLKTALFPLHFWLPGAHAGAPAPGSAILSALVVKASFYVLLRVWFVVYDGRVPHAAAQLLGWLGAAAIVWGSLQALRQQRLKLLIAHSTVAQIGYLFLLMPMAVETGAAVASAAWGGAIYHLLSHACAKAAMFMAAGNIIRALGHDRIREMRGATDHMPVTVHAFGLAGLSLMGLPPTGGFVGKWLLVNASIASGQWWWAGVILLGGLMAGGYVFRFLRQATLSTDEPARFKPAPRVMEAAAMGLALVSLALGLRAVELLALIGIGST
jgi:multicomponent Na+:H+ antiporter subunit D